MSKSSEAAFGGLFAGSMKHAAPILFWSAITLFIGSVASTIALASIPADYGEQEGYMRATIWAGALVQGLNNAVWPFTGAAIVWTLQRRKPEAAE